MRDALLACALLCAAPAWAQVAPVPNTSCGNLATSEFGGTFGNLSGASTWRNLQIPPGGGYRYGPSEQATFPLSGTGSEGRYAVTSQQGSANLHGSVVHWQNLPGHNQGAPNPGSATDAYLAVNGSTGTAIFYRQELVLVPNQSYRLSMFAINAINLVGYNGTLPNLQVRIVNSVTGAVVAQDDTGPLPDKEGAFVGPSDWTQAVIDFNSGAAMRFRIEVSNISTARADNDFAVDDITIAPLTEAGCPIDFGDAPDATNGTARGNYQTRLADNGPRHTQVGGLFIGTTTTPESDALHNPTATGDVDDGTVGTLNLFAGQTLTIPVGVTNTTGEQAYLAGFLDFNRDGDFLDAGEALSPVSVPTNTGALQTVNMNFTVPANAVPGDSIVRFRLASTPSQIATAVGLSNRGEVEDYLTTLQSTVTLTKAWVGATAGDAVSLTITGGTSPTAGASTAGGSTTPARALANVGDVVTVTEAFTSGDATRYLTTLRCTKNTDGSEVATNGAGLSRTLTMPGDSPVTCTYRNDGSAVDLSISKSNTADTTDAANDNVVSGASTSYNVVVTNAGPGAANGAVVQDSPASGLSGCSVPPQPAGCTAAGGAVCPAATGNLLVTNGVAVPVLPAGGSLTFTVNCMVE